MKLDMNCRIMERLRLMRQHNVLCDLEVCSNDGFKRRIHSCVWVAAFEEGQNLLSNKYKGIRNKLSNIELSSVNADMLSTIIDFIYGEEVSSIPVGLDGALKELGFHDFKYYLNSGLSDYMSNKRSPVNCAANDTCNNKLNNKPLSENTSSNLHSDSLQVENVQVKDEIVEDNTVKSVSTSGAQNDTQQTLDSAENYMSSVQVKLEPVESMEDTWNTDEEKNDQIGNIKIYSKQEADDQTVTVCVKYDSVMNNDDGEDLGSEKQLQGQPSTQAGKSVEEDKEIPNNLSKEVPISQQSKAVYIASNSPQVTRPLTTTSECGQIAKNPPILPKFSSNQGDIVTVATFLSFAELQKQGKSWKLQENLVPIPMSGNSVDTFNKLPIFPQTSQAKCMVDKKSRGRPKAPETEKAKISNKSQKKSIVNKGPGNPIPKATAVQNKMNRSAFSDSGPKTNNVLLTSSCSTSTTSPIHVSMVKQSQSITKCSNVVNGRTVVTPNVQSNLPIPMNLSSFPTPVRIAQPGEGFGAVHTMIPCVDFNDSIPVGCIHSVSPGIPSNVLLPSKSSISECIQQQSLDGKVSQHVIGGNTLFSIPSSNQYIINPSQVFPASTITITSASALQPNLMNTVSASKLSKKQKAMSKSLSAPILSKKCSPVNVHKSVPTYREIKPKLRNPTFIAITDDTCNTESKDQELQKTGSGNKRLELPKSPNQRLEQPKTVNHEDAKPMRKPRKRTRSLQNNKTLLNEPVDKYILDNVKRTKRNVPSTLKIKMNAINPQLRFMKRKNPKDMVAELFKNSTAAELKSTSKKT